MWVHILDLPLALFLFLFTFFFFSFNLPFSSSPSGLSLSVYSNQKRKKNTVRLWCYIYIKTWSIQRKFADEKKSREKGDAQLLFEEWSEFRERKKMMLQNNNENEQKKQSAHLCTRIYHGLVAWIGGVGVIERRREKKCTKKYTEQTSNTDWSLISERAYSLCLFASHGWSTSNESWKQCRQNTHRH